MDRAVRSQCPRCPLRAGADVPFGSLESFLDDPMMSDAAPEAPHELRTVADNTQVVVFYSLTGLDEGGISFAERLRSIAAVRDIFPNTFVFTRPIIRNRNDDPATLRRLSQAAADLTGQLVLGGLHDAKKRKRRLGIPMRPVLHLYDSPARIADVRCAVDLYDGHSADIAAVGSLYRA